MQPEKYISKYIMVLAFAISCFSLFGQTMESDSLVSCRLKDTTTVMLIKKPSFKKESHQYYYLPVNLRISRKENDQFEFSFLTYKENDEGPIEGGLLHWLLKWGLTSTQEEEVQMILEQEIDSIGVLMGAIPIDYVKNDPGMLIVSESPVATVLRNSLRSTGTLPLYPGSKIASSFYFNAEDAQTMEKALLNTSELEGISIQFHFKLSELYANTSTIHSYVLQGNLQDWIEDIHTE